MTPRTVSLMWTGAGVTLLGGLWLALWWAPAFAHRLGMAFLATPVVLAVITVWRSAERDRLTLLCLAALVLLFLVAWFV